MNILLDLALGLCLLSILYTSWRRGFVASFIRLVGTAAGFLLASFLSGPVSERLYGSLLEERVEQYVGDTLLAPGSPLLEALAGLDQAGSAAIQAVSGFLAQQGLDFYSPQDAGQMGTDILDRITQGGSDPAAAITQVAVKPLVMTVLETAIFFLLLFLTGILVRMAVRVGLGVNRIPLVGGMNRLAGLLCGAVYALLVGYVVSMGLLLLAGLGKNQWDHLNSDVLQETFLIRRFLELRDYLP
ncbi:MAG: hypothetical protein HFF14_02260 [Angelakisella sp.]|nr:hypothetical protein [Angelakisella sp.]